MITEHDTIPCAETYDAGAFYTQAIEIHDFAQEANIDTVNVKPPTTEVVGFWLEKPPSMPPC